jgi:Lrp/AsnC family leucine-responsive transcriptional regulator
MIDDTDRQILEILQENARTPNAEIARQLNLAPSGIHERLKKLEKRGVITGYCLALDPGKLGYGVTAFSFIRTNEKPGDDSSVAQLEVIPEVEAIYHIAGEDCYLVKLRCKSNEDLGRLLREGIGTILAVQSSRTSIVMETKKEGGALPLAK